MENYYWEYIFVRDAFSYCFVLIFFKTELCLDDDVMIQLKNINIQFLLPHIKMAIECNNNNNSTATGM